MCLSSVILFEDSKVWGYYKYTLIIKDPFNWSKEDKDISNITNDFYLKMNAVLMNFLINKILKKCIMVLFTKLFGCTTVFNTETMLSTKWLARFKWI